MPLPIQGALAQGQLQGQAGQLALVGLAAEALAQGGMPAPQHLLQQVCLGDCTTSALLPRSRFACSGRNR